MNTIVLNIQPSYAGGSMYTWSLDPSFVAHDPLHFRIQQGATHSGPWDAISPDIVDQYAWRGPPKVVPKDPVLYYRVAMTCGGQTVYSPVRTPYGDLNRREFLLVADIMRRELLQMEQMAGVRGHIFIKAVYGSACTKCRDPITGDVLKQDCSACFGTGRIPGYHGPYDTWITFTPQRRNKAMQGDQTTTREPYGHDLRMLGTPPVKKDDVIVDTRQDKRYYVDSATNLTEVRRVPIVQSVRCYEIPSSSPIYRLGLSDG